MKKLLFFGILLAVLDQALKFFIAPVTFNKGAAFGLFEGWKWFFIFVAFLVLFFLLYYHQKFQGLGLIGAVFLFGGALGNLLDRIFFGAVRDFLSFCVLKICIPYFNVADVFNLLGVLLLLYAFRKS